MSESWENLTRREKDQRRVDAHQSMVKLRRDGLVRSGMDPDKAERKAKHDQTVTSNRAWATYQRDDGHK